MTFHNRGSEGGMTWQRPEWVSWRVRKFYREQPRIDPGEREGRAVQSDLYPGSVDRRLSLDEVVDRKLAEERFLSVPYDWERLLGEGRH